MILDIDKDVIKRINHSTTNLDNIKSQIDQQRYLLKSAIGRKIAYEDKYAMTAVPAGANPTTLTILFVYMRNIIPYPMWIEVHVSTDQIVRYNTDSAEFMRKYGGMRVEDLADIKVGDEVMDEIAITALSRLNLYMTKNNISEDCIFVSESVTAQKAI